MIVGRESKMRGFMRVAPSIVHDRVDFAASMIDGRTVTEVDGKGKSAAEMTELWDFVLARMTESTKVRKHEKKAQYG